jgi:hypothetical protein
VKGAPGWVHFEPLTWSRQAPPFAFTAVAWGCSDACGGLSLGPRPLAVGRVYQAAGGPRRYRT